MSSTMPTKIQLLNAAVNDARNAYNQAVADFYTFGVNVVWMHGGHRQTGVVIRCDAHARLWVRNDITRKAVWIESTRLI